MYSFKNNGKQTTQNKQRKINNAKLANAIDLWSRFAISPKGYATRTHTLYISVYLMRDERMGGEFSDASTSALGDIHPLA
ncbi:MAG: hypothetical protein F6K56_38200 [Moorea sp. SIO3G5]|nr:hypothetical protein [Moorena sp. SIO3G5]